MKTKKLLLGLTLVLSIIGCNRLPSNAPTPQVKNVKVSSCQKGEKRTTDRGEKINKAYSYISYKYKNHTLWLTHYNIDFNCDKRGIGANTSLLGNTLTIKEWQHLPPKGGEFCHCPYNIEIQLNNISPQQYTISYDNGLSKHISFTIDLKSKKEGIKSFSKH